MALSTEGENMRRESDARRGIVEAARQGPSAQARQAQAGNVAGDANGYFDDAAGAPALLFRLGASRLGDGSRLR